MDELERFKSEISLAEVAAAHGYQLDRQHSSRSSLVMRHPDGDKIVVATGEDGHGVFFSVRTNASGSVIDFVMERRGLNLGQVRGVLRPYLSGGVFSFPTAKSSPLPRLPKPQPIPHDRAALVSRWLGFRPYGGGYLEGRGLSRETIAAFAERIRLDERGNTVFRHDDLDGLLGWEVKNRGFTGFVGGGLKALFGVRVEVAPQTSPPRVALAESAIDVMSFYQTDPKPGLYLSFGGSLSPEQHALLGDVLTRYPEAEVVAATDNDPEGDEFADLIGSIRPDVTRARPPKGKDWNDAIRPPAPPAESSAPSPP